MATNNTQQSRYRMISIMTFVVMLLAFAYYYFIYVQNNKEAFNSKSFRIIEQAAENLESKHNNYKKVAKNVVSKFDESHQIITGFVLRAYLYKIVGGYHVPEGMTVVANEKYVPSSSEAFVDSIFVSKIGQKVAFYTEMESLVEGILGNGFFQKYIVFSDSQVYWSDFATTPNFKINTDTLFKRESGAPNNLFHSSDRQEIEFNNTTHLLYFSPVSLSGKTIYIGGVVEKSYFSKQAFEIGPNTLTVILVLLLLLILSLPFLKLLLLSENERLGTWDAVFSFVVMALGAGFIMLSLLSYYSHQGPSKKYKEDVLKTYASKIEENVLTELDDIVKQMDKNDSLLQIEEQNNTSKRRPCDDKMIATNYDKTRTSSNYDTSIYRHSKGMSWINSEAQQLVKWQPKNITTRVEVPFRKYFSFPDDDRNILWTDKNVNNGEGFYIEAIRAITTGESYAVISKRSKVDSLKGVNFCDKKATVVTLGAELQSLTNLSMPSNISYLVIDQQGEVVFHKNNNKIFQENLFIETNSNKHLMEAVYGRTDTVFRSYYDETHHRFYITPLGNLPLFLLTVLDEKREKMSDAQVFSLSMLFYGVLVLLLFIQISLFVVIDYRRKQKTRGYNLFFKWMWPMPAKKKLFQVLSVYFLVSVLVYFFGSFYKNVWITFSFFSLLTTINVFVLRGFKKPFDLISKPHYLKYYLYFAFALLLGILLFPFSDQINMLQKYFFFLFIVLSAITVYVSFTLKKIDTGKPLNSTYKIWIFLFVLVVGVMPVLSFFTKAYNFEKSLHLQHMQLSLAEQIVHSGELFGDTDYRDYSCLNDDLIYGVITPEDKIVYGRDYALIKELRIWIGDKIERSAILRYAGFSSNELLEWNEYENAIQLIYNHGKTPLLDSDAISLTANKTQISPIDFLLPEKGFSDFRFEMLIVFLLLLIFLYLVVGYWSSKLFLLGIIPKLKSNISDLLKNSSFVYIVSPPHAGVRAFIEKQLGSGIYFEDLRYTSSSDKKPTKPEKSDEIAMVFDAGSIDNETIKYSVQRINALKKLVLKNELKKLIVVSQFTPKKVLNTVIEKEQLLRESDQAKTLTELKKLSDQYLDIIGGFSLAYYKLGKDKSSESTVNDHFLKNELRGVSILDEQLVIKTFRDSNCDEEEMVLNIQNKAQLYYYAIWNSLEKREHLLIYDLAQDGLVNYRNLYVIYNLMSRGILVHKNGRLKLFNKSFANFVLSIIDKEQALEFERDAKRTGNWANLRLPFMIVIAAALMFMFLTQQQVFNQLIGWFTASIALLPILTRFMVTFTGFSKK